MDKLSFLDGAEAPNDDVQPEETVAEEAVDAAPETPAEPEPKAEQPRNDKGQFAPKDKEEASQPASEPAPAAPPQDEPKTDQIMVPLAALHETRDKVRDLEARLAQHRQPQPQPMQVPDPIEDPEGYQQFQAQQLDNARYQDRLFFSERLAVMQHGEDAFAKAREWGIRKCDEDPHFNARVRTSPDPYSVVMGEYQREQIVSQVSPSDFEAFLAWKAAQGKLQAQQQPAAPAAAPETPAPPASIASAPSAGGGQHVATGSGVAFDETFRN